MNKLLPIAVALAITGCGENVPLPLEKALTDYTILKATNSKGIPIFKDRNFGSLHIYSNSKSLEERAQTSLLAAKDYLEKENVKFVKVCHLMANEPDLIGTAICPTRVNYAPDGKGDNGKSSFKHKTWEAVGVKDEFDPLSIKIQILWSRNDLKFEKEDDLKEFISKSLDNRVSAADIRLPNYNMVDL